jgi:hypothetical protein
MGNEDEAKGPFGPQIFFLLLHNSDHCAMKRRMLQG